MNTEGHQIAEEIHFSNRKVKVYSNRPKNLTELLRNTVEKFPENEALVFGDQRLSFRSFAKQVDNIAYNLASQWQIQKGDRVAILLENCIEFCTSVFAIAQLGGISVPLNARLKSSELEFMLNNSGSRLLITDTAFLSELEPIKVKVKLDQIFIINDNELPLQTLHFNILTRDCKETIVRDVSEEDTAFILYTSGTTGMPKGARATHFNIMHTCINYQRVMYLVPTDRTLISVPLFHVTGLVAQLILNVYVGLTTVLMRKFSSKLFVELLDKEKISQVGAVPAIFVLMLKYLEDNPDYDLSALRLIGYGGSPMAPSTIEALQSRFPSVQLLNAYGSTETTSPATILTGEDVLKKSASVGRPVPVAECKVMDENGKELPQGEVGELWIKGPMVVPGYWNNEESNLQEFTDGFWHSGDLARIDEEGFVYIMDRKKDMINRGGEKIFSIEVEEILYRHPKVLEAVIVGVPDPIFGEQVKAVLVLREGETAEVEEIRSFVAINLADYKVPKYVEFRNMLPRNPAGKVLKAALKQLAAQ